MSLKRYAARRDSTEAAIVTALRKFGAQVLTLDRFDLLVLFRGQLFMLDAKAGRARTTVTQDTLIALGWPLHYVKTPDEALRAIGAVK